jgi:hypothetical protein
VICHNPRVFLGEVFMAVRVLTIQEFDRFRSGRSRLARLTDQAVEWFADDAGAVLGAIAYHRFQLDWSFIVLARDSVGKFRAIARDTGLPDLGEARRLLVEKMATAKMTRRHVPSSHQPTAD